MLVSTAQPFSFIPFCVLCILCRVRVLVFIFKIYSRPHNGHFKGNIMDLMLYSSIQFFCFSFSHFLYAVLSHGSLNSFWIYAFVMRKKVCEE